MKFLRVMSIAFAHVSLARMVTGFYLIVWELSWAPNGKMRRFKEHVTRPVEAKLL